MRDSEGTVKYVSEQNKKLKSNQEKAREKRNSTFSNDLSAVAFFDTLEEGWGSIK